MAQARKSQRRGSKVSTVSSKRGMEFTKKIVILTALLFIVSLLDIRAEVREGLDVSGYATQVLITTGGIFGASIVFYLNKSKIENLSKGKIRFMLLRLRLEIKLKDQLPEETYTLIMEEIDEIDRMMDTKLDGALEEAITITTSTSNGNDIVNGYLYKILQCMGANVVANIGIKLFGNNPVEYPDDELISRYADIVKENLDADNHLNISSQQEQLFQNMKEIMKNNNTSYDAHIWREKGYLECANFVDLIERKRNEDNSK